MKTKAQTTAKIYLYCIHLSMSSAQVRSGPGVPCSDLTLSHAPLDFSYVTPRNWRDGVSMPGEAAGLSANSGGRGA